MTETGTAGGPATDVAVGGPFALAASAVHAHIRDVPDWPRPGVVFKDITPLLAAPAAFAAVVDALAAAATAAGATKIVGIEARGFLLAAPVAYRVDAGFVPVRKQGKLPGVTISESYELEYGSATLEVHADAFTPGDRVFIIDDVLATGGTAVATRSLVERAGGVALGIAVLLELTFLAGRERVAPLPVDAVLPV
jgi:adenine phosphoribosyltransferase